MTKIFVDKSIEEIKQEIRAAYPTKETKGKFVVYHSKWIALRIKFEPYSDKIHVKGGCEFTPRTLVVLTILFIFGFLPIIIGFFAYWYYSYKFEKELAILVEYGE